MTMCNLYAEQNEQIMLSADVVLLINRNLQKTSKPKTTKIPK